MNLQIFSPIGYVSVLLWLAMLALWAAHALRRPRGWWCHLALAAGLLALICAKINSTTYVNRIQVDQSEQIAAEQARRDAARKAAEDARKGEVAQIRFAEDDADDFLDKAGMEEADKKYLENAGKSKQSATEDPAWKREKKTRSGSRTDDSLEGMLNPEGTQKAADSLDNMTETEEAVAPIVMSAEDHYTANRLDSLNLKWIKILLALGALYVVIDYLRRLNIYNEAYFPLPVPSAWPNSFTPMPTMWSRPARPRRSMTEELTWLIRRGDAFLYLTDDQTAAAEMPRKTYRLPAKLEPVDVLHVSPDQPLLDDTFIFEGVWFNRASFVISSATRAAECLNHLLEKLRGREETRARVSQTVHIIWDLATPIPEHLRAELLKLAEATGISVMENRET
ncbi:MAG: hypothetical protein RRC34_10535 [Lentisphaeria bacterium]|nr:hypothetical protein [Lentisphaeria bacterium]